MEKVRINLFTSYYQDPFPKRQDELDFCLRWNAIAGFDKINLLLSIEKIRMRIPIPNADTLFFLVAVFLIIILSNSMMEFVSQIAFMIRFHIRKAVKTVCWKWLIHLS